MSRRIVRRLFVRRHLLAATVVGLTACTTQPPGEAPLFEQLSEADIALADGAVQRALETSRSGTAVEWRNAANGTGGMVMPLRTYRSSTGLYCRDYRELLTVGGNSERYADTACRDTDGQWRVVR